MANSDFSNIDDDKENEGEMETSDDEENDEYETESSDDESENATSRVYLPNNENNSDVKLECDESAYVCYYALKTGSPCLSFDIIPDGLGNNRADQYPLTMTLVGGTEVKKIQNNCLLVMKLTDMQKNQSPKSEDEESESESDDEDNKPGLETAAVRHTGCVNRVKVTSLGDEIFAASWSELQRVQIWNLSRPLNAVNDKRVMAAYVQNNEVVEPAYTFSGHQSEGFAMDWSPLVPGMLATGDCKSNIHLWKPLEGGTWHIDQRPYKAHTDSVEDIAWSPNENNVMATCSVDKSIRIWDIRANPNKACMLTKNDAHDSDVNVISWNKRDPFILSGGDDGCLKVWDLRQFPGSEAICTFKYHTAPITSVEWHPTDYSAFAASGSDDLVTQWDLAVERDDTEQNQDDTEQDPRLKDLPPQLLFIHQGQNEVKELHWHKQMPGVLISTAQTGLNIFRTISI